MEFVILVHPRNVADNDNVPLTDWECIAKFSAPSIAMARTTAIATTQAYLLDHPRTIAIVAQFHSRFGLSVMTLKQEDF